MDKNGYSPLATQLTSPLQFLTQQQADFVKYTLAGKAPTVAARMAGYKYPDRMGHSILKSPKVQAAVRFLYKKHEKAGDISRKKVMDGLLEAIEQAKMMADPASQISGWREIGRMCGYYAPEVKKIDISVSSKRVIDQLEVLSDDELMRMVEENDKVIEGEATNILEVAQAADDAEFAARQPEDSG